MFFRITYCNIGLLYYFCINVVITKIKKEPIYAKNAYTSWK
jgi:hypothetical protein